MLTVLITRNLPPLRGGMERVNLELARVLAEDGELLVIGPTGCGEWLPPGTSVWEVDALPLRRFLVRSLWLAWRARRLRPGRVVAGSGLCSMQARIAAVRGAKTCVYVHGLDLVAGHPLYRWGWLPQLRRFDTAIANSRSTADSARRIGVAAGRVSVVHPGVTLPQERSSIGREELGWGDGPVLLSVGRLTRRKGLLEFVQEALPQIVRHHPKAKLVVIGDAAQDAATGALSGGHGALRTAAESSGIGPSVLFMGPCDDSTLQGAYEAADVHVFPVRAVTGDVEGFGMVAIEAAAHGLPTVAFALGGVPDAVREGHSGHLVTPGDYSAFADRVCTLIERARGSMANSCRAWADGFAWPIFRERVRSALAMDQHCPQRQGHAVLNVVSRAHKARKVELLLGLGREPAPLRLLEIGTGSGGMASYFATKSPVPFQVWSVDVEDTRQVTEGYKFRLVDGAGLPFDAESFDVVLSNHVIEHVGDYETQLHHLREMGRVLKADGVGYLAVPNRWQVVEPHYKIAFLSWLPPRFRSTYLRLRRRGNHYDCSPLSRHEIERALAATGFCYEQQHAKALRLTFELERPHARAYRLILKHIPDWLYRIARSAFPTLIYCVARSPARMKEMKFPLPEASKPVEADVPSPRVGRL